MVKRLLTISSVIGLLALLSAPRAKADALKLACVSTCTSGGTSLIVSNSSVTFNYYQTGQVYTGSGFIGIVVPTGGSTPTLTGYSLEESVAFGSGDSFDAVLGESDLDSGYNFSNLSSASEQVGVTPTGFTIYEFDLGTVSGVSGLQANNLSNGSIIVGWLETTKKDSPITFQTPLSESITSGGTSVPEPGTASLLGFGLLGLACVGLIRRRSTGVTA